MHDLLIMSCSAKKRADAHLLPALERYDGGAYRVVKKACAEVPGLAERLTILIVSAEYGLITATTPIPWYDRIMDAARAREMRDGVAQAVRTLIGPRRLGRVLISGGKHYRYTLHDVLPLLAERSVSCTGSSGGIGTHMHQLYQWLREERGIAPPGE